METKDKKKLFIMISLLLFLITTGVIGYMSLIKVSFIDALYMTIITISTVGYGEVGKMTEDSKLFSIFIIFGGISIVGYAFTNIVSIFIDGVLNQAWKVKKMENKISKLKDHYIICGAGETGQSVIKRFKESNHLFVVIDDNEDIYEELMQNDILVVNGDATHEDVLEKAALVVKPSVISFLDMITRAGDVVLDLESVIICEDSTMEGKTLREVKIPEQTGLIVLAIKKSWAKEFAFNPNSEEIIELDDILIVLGEDEQVDKLRKIACDDGSNPI